MGPTGDFEREPRRGSESACVPAARTLAEPKGEVKRMYSSASKVQHWLLGQWPTSFSASIAPDLQFFLRRRTHLAGGTPFHLRGAPKTSRVPHSLRREQRVRFLTLPLGPFALCSFDSYRISVPFILEVRDYELTSLFHFHFSHGIRMATCPCTTQKLV